MQTNVLEYLEETVKVHPHKIAFTDGQDSLTFREVYDQARAIGSWLAAKGVTGQSVAVLMKKHPRTITAFLGSIYGGNYYVPLDPEMPPQRMEWILKKTKAKILLCDETTQECGQLLHFGGHAIAYTQAAFGIIQEDVLRKIRNAQLDIDPIYIVFTSGSTGVPKGVVGCHRSVIDYIEHLCPVLNFRESTIFGNQTPLFVDACLKEILPTLKLGATLHLIPKKLFLFPVLLVEYLNQNKINTLCWVVSALTLISALGTFEKVVPQWVHTVAFASEVFPIRQLKLWRHALPEARFINLYGPTETTGICCYYEVDRDLDEQDILPIGKPFPNTQVLLLNEQGRQAANGEAGEICIRGTRLTLGYFMEPDRTEAAFVQNPLNPLYPEKIYRTGDLGQYNERGELLFLSRKDHQIKHMGHRIELGEIEAAAASCAQVQSVGCVYREERKKIILYYVGNLSASELTVFLRNKLQRFMLPNLIRQLDSMPTLPNGKLDRTRLSKFAEES